MVIQAPIYPIFPSSGTHITGNSIFNSPTVPIATSVNTNPLQDYSSSTAVAKMTTGGVVVNQVYAVEGVIGSVNNNTSLRYYNPATNQVNNTSAGQVNLQNNAIPQTSWVSPVVDDSYNTGFNLTFQFNKTTYLNYIVFDILEVPCTWALYQGSVSPGSELYNGIINTYNPSSYQTVQLELNSTYTFNSTIPLILVLTKVATGTQYSFSIQNFIAKYVITQYSDLTVSGNTTVSGIIAQNSLGFIETYTPTTFPLSNMLIPNQGQTYWKSSPQPVKDAVVDFVLDLGIQQEVNRMYLDPLYIGSPLNIYYSDVHANVTDYTTLTWYPINRDFTMKKGLYVLPSTFTRYLKFEITQLTPEPYILPLDSVNKTIQVFPDWVDSYYDTIEQGISDINGATYNSLAGSTTPQTAIYTSTNYNTAPQILSNYGQATSQLSSNTFGGSTSTNSTGNYSVVDPTISYKTLLGVGDFGSLYNNTINGQFINKRFFNYGTHQYKNVNINQTWHQVYFTGIKYLSLYAYAPNEVTEYEEFIDYFLPTIVASGVYTPSATTIISGGTATYGIAVGDATAASGTMTVAGGWTGLAGQYVQTKNLQTFQSFNSFKLGAQDYGWEPFFSQTATLLNNAVTVNSGNVVTVPAINVVISGVNLTSNNITQTANPLYNIFSISGSSGTSWIKSGTTGSLNLFTTAQAQVVSGTGWTGQGGPVVSGGNVITTSGIVQPTLSQWSSSYANEQYAGALTFGGIGASSTGNNPYTFLVTAYGTGSVTVSGLFYGTGNSLVASGSQTFTIASSGTQISYTANATSLGTKATLQLIPTANTTFFNAGWFQGSSANYTNPIVLNNMNVSAVARIYLPNTNYGTYACGLYSIPASGTQGVLVASQSFNNLPTQTWVDIVVPYNLQNTSYINFYVELSQSFGNGPGTVGETYEVAMLGIFYSPINYQFSIDGGTTWNNIITGINNPNVNINTPSSTQQLSIKANYLQDKTYIQALEIVPNLTQTPFYTTANIEQMSNPKVNEVQTLTPPSLRPLFQLNSEPIPYNYSIQQLMNINNPYQLP